jgi:hypothetical protein
MQVILTTVGAALCTNKPRVEAPGRRCMSSLVEKSRRAVSGCKQLPMNKMGMSAVVG